MKIIILLRRVIMDSPIFCFISFIISPLGNYLFFFPERISFYFSCTLFLISYIHTHVHNSADSIIYLCKLLSKIIIILLIILSAKFALTMVTFSTDITPFPGSLSKHPFQPKSSASAHINHFRSSSLHSMQNMDLF